MPKETFYKLKDDKRNLITNILTEEFQKKSLYEATIKDIVKRLNISRGSFYQYFLDLEEAYFYILDEKINYIHLAFFKLYKEYNDIKKALISYGQFLSEEIYKEENYRLLMNRCLSWNYDLEKKWKKYKYSNKEMIDLKEMYNNKRLNIVGSMLHILMQKLFENRWTREEFLIEYAELVKFIMEGINYV